MKKYLSLISLILLFNSCNPFPKPNIKVISQDLGIQFPNKYQIVKAMEDWLGFDTTQNFDFVFEQNEFNQLINSIKKSPAYNTSNDFYNLPVKKKKQILKKLIKHGLTGYWIKTDYGFRFEDADMDLNGEHGIKIDNHNINRKLTNYRNIRGELHQDWGIEASVTNKTRKLCYSYFKF